MGVRHVRALIVFLIAAPALAHEIGTTQVEVVFHRDHTFTATITGAARVEPEVRFDSALSRVRERAAAQPRVRVVFTGQIPPNAKTFTWRNRRAYSTYSLTIVDESSFAPRSGEKVPKADEGRTLTRRVQWIDADATSAPYALSHTVEPSRTDIIRQYLALGFTHIIPEGLDHILFVLGMFLLTRRVRDVLAQVTAFTTAHSITLGLTMYGAVSVSPRIVEPAIALSIAYIAIENVITTHVRPWRVAVVFCFGLLHGMGFAGVLKELGLPRSQFLPALVSFNVGVECGQLTVIAAAFLLFAHWWQSRQWYRARFVVPASAAIGAVGLFWAVQRLL